MKLTRFEMTLTEDGLRTRAISFDTHVQKDRYGKYLHSHEELKTMRLGLHNCVFTESDVIERLRKAHFQINSDSPPTVHMFYFEGERDIDSMEPYLLRELRVLLNARRDGLIQRWNDVQRELGELDTLDLKLKELKGEGAWT